MNTSNVLKASLIAALFAAGAAAQAAPVGEGDTLSAQPAQVQSTRSFASNQAASLSSVSRNGVANIDSEGFGSTVQSPRASHLDRAIVRQAALQAERSGAIASGDALSF